MPLFVVATVGLTLIVVESSILAPIRSRLPGKLQELVGCYLCSGFWSGMLCGVLLGLPWFLAASAGACLGQFGASLLARLDR